MPSQRISILRLKEYFQLIKIPVAWKYRFVWNIHGGNFCIVERRQLPLCLYPESLAEQQRYEVLWANLNF